MPLPFRSLLLAVSLTLAPSLLQRAQAGDPGNRPAATVRGATYYGDPSRRALDGSRRTDGYDLAPYGRPRETLPVQTITWRDPAAMPPAPIWGGFYLGLNAGGGTGTIDTNFGDIDGAGGLLGAHIGYLARFGALAAGIEIDADFSFIDDRQTIGAGSAFTTELAALSSARARFGFDAGPVLLYATGGVALAKLTVSASGPGFHASASETSVGLVFGGGLQIPINDRLALRLEALHYMFGEERAETPLGTLESQSDVTTLRAGLSLSFN